MKQLASFLYSHPWLEWRLKLFNMVEVKTDDEYYEWVRKNMIHMYGRSRFPGTTPDSVGEHIKSEMVVPVKKAIIAGKKK